jgi:hypothetical protein
MRKWGSAAGITRICRIGNGKLGFFRSFAVERQLKCHENEEYFPKLRLGRGGFAEK